MLRAPTTNTGEDWPSYYSNFAFDYQQYHFIATDFTTRAEAGGSPVYPGLDAIPEVNEGSSWDWTWDWLHSQVTDGRKLVILGHQPYTSDLVNSFCAAKLSQIADAGLLNNHPVAQMIGGHVHAEHSGITFNDWPVCHDTICHYYTAAAAKDGNFCLLRFMDSVQAQIVSPQPTVMCGSEVHVAGNLDFRGDNNAPSSYNWDFGDAGHAECPESGVDHTYHLYGTHDGYFKTTLSVVTQAGRPVSTSQLVHVKASPYSLRGTVGERKVDLAWGFDSPNAVDYYEIWRQVHNSGMWYRISNDVHELSYEDANLNPDFSFDYMVRAHHTEGWGFSAFDTVSDFRPVALNPPTGLTASLGTDGHVHLAWVNNSQYATNFLFRRTTDGVPREDYYTPYEYIQGQLSAVDTTSMGHIYDYWVRAASGQYTSEWSNSAEFFVPGESDSAPPTAWNNAGKLLAFGNEVHLVYSATVNGMQRVLYRHSTDGGSSWGAPEYVSPMAHDGMYPSLVLDCSGSPYVIWVTNWELLGGEYQTPPWVSSFYLSAKQSGQWAATKVCDILGDYGEPSPKPTFPVPQASFTVTDNKGYLAFSFPDDGRVQSPQPGVHVASFSLVPPSQFSDTRLGAYCDSNSPSVLTDNSGRKIVAYSYGQSDTLWYENAGAQSYSKQGFDRLGNRLFGRVDNLTARLDGSTVLLTWGSPDVTGGYDTLKFVQLNRQPGGNYAPACLETIAAGTGNPEDVTVRPQFVAGALWPMVVYEDYARQGQPGMTYAIRVGQRRWQRGDMGDDNGIALCPQGCVCGNRLVGCWSRSVGQYPPYDYYLLSALRRFVWVKRYLPVL